MCLIIFNDKVILSVGFNYILAHKQKKNFLLLDLGKGKERNMAITGNSLNINHVFGTQPEQQRQQ